ncbi:MAG: AAA family ATPase [Coriobacteriales bacterium]|jgi:SpoVK/Ycf46/Vps4 family AAA+-type ATPase|nr:AAA family ATPase [Coriobacteriales bacterium]
MSGRAHKTRIMLMVLVDVSCADESDQACRERLASLDDAVNSYKKELRRMGAGHNVVIATAAFANRLFDHSAFNNDSRVDFSPVVSDSSCWAEPLAWAMKKIEHAKKVYDLENAIHFPPIVLFFSASNTEDRYGEAIEALRDARANGDITVRAIGTKGRPELLALQGMTDDVVLVDPKDTTGWVEEFFRTTDMIKAVLNGKRPFDSVAVKTLINETINTLDLGAGVFPEQAMAKISMALKKQNAVVRNKLDLESDATFSIEEARAVVKALNSMCDRMPERCRGFAEDIGVQYRAASSARTPSSPEDDSRRLSEESSGDSAVQSLPKKNKKGKKATEQDVPKTMELPLEIMTKSEMELAALIGLDEVKAVVGKIVALAKLNKRYPRRGKPRQTFLHMAFLGNPGTAKTTVARLLAKILQEHGILRKAELVEVGRDGLIGRYVGSTAPKVVAAFDKAKGSILFIDEAHSLVDSGRGDYGDEALATIVKEMENRCGDPVVIMAGYPREMEALLHQNAGLKSRIKFIVNFPDYSDEEMLMIAERTAKQYGYALAGGIREKVMSMIAEARRDETFGNGRWARSLIEQAELNLADRLIKLSIDEIDDAMRNTLTAKDFETPPDIKLKHRKQKIGFMPQERNK